MSEKTYPYIRYSKETYSETEMIARSRSFFEWMDQRRTVREFSDKPVPEEVLENIIRAASTAPSGAHKQPWTFCLVTNPEIKTKIREAAEKEEYDSYNGRMTQEWLDDLAPLGTDWQKPFLETAPALIVVFKRIYEEKNGKKKNNYYVAESVGLACGFLLAAIHHAGLAALTHTPSPMNFLCKVLERPDNERPFLLIPVGYAAENVTVPDLQRKPAEQVIVKYERSFI
ncbi:MAG: Iodotyrosine dehalogenase protein [Bacteroidetes bacterium]|nr:MAG: Iodotyrosine dehalogenase protein [Bacteroidota bacterium]